METEEAYLMQIIYRRRERKGPPEYAKIRVAEMENAKEGGKDALWWIVDGNYVSKKMGKEDS